MFTYFQFVEQNFQSIFENYVTTDLLSGSTTDLVSVIEEDQNLEDVRSGPLNR